MRKLAEQFGVSTTVVHQAAAALEKCGLLERRAKSGVFVAEHSGNLRLAIGVVTTIGREGGMGGYFEQLMTTMRNAGGVAIPISIHHETPWEKDIDNLLMQDLSGVLVDVEAELFKYHQLISHFKRIPTCFVNRWEWDENLPPSGILIDYAEMTRQTLTYLINKGHHRIVFLGHKPEPLPFKKRYLETAANSVGIKLFSPELNYVCFEDFVNNPIRVKQVFETAEAPTAIFSHGDSILFEFMSKIKAVYPACQDMEMVGCFNTLWSKLPGQEFSSWQVDCAEMWTRAVNALADNKKEVEWVLPSFMERGHAEK
jgi:DNA-binding LacI/PurR family transcriptional regulator